jgi:hypothetical protein
MALMYDKNLFGTCKLNVGYTPVVGRAVALVNCLKPQWQLSAGFHLL